MKGERLTTPDARLMRDISRLLKQYTLGTVIEAAWDVSRAEFAAAINRQRATPTEVNARLARKIIARHTRRQGEAA